MELKNYQAQVLKDLENYIEELLITRRPSQAYVKHWKSKNIRVGYEGIAPYKEVIPSVPSVCLKVPTGGGKTLLGCCSLKKIFDKMPLNKKKVVVWLVPWETILTQTYNSLANPEHFYHQQLIRDFSGKVEIYNKKQAMNAQNINASSIGEQLSIFVMSFDTFRSKTKENRKIYEPNPNLAQMTAVYEDRDAMVKDVDETALIQVLNQLNPVVIIDESHNAKSNLSIEMIKNLNPSFVVELTATPKENSNIISIVSSDSLKNEHMVKLPVIAYNRPSIERVIVEAIDLQRVLEEHAKLLYNKESENERKYIRPIVLFQAQPKTSDDNITFEKIKENLINSGIPAEQIAIKTANKNEIANIDLMSSNCQIRFIITVNALKEGWDCPFAYILASLANKTSKIDVEQILGRILRQPYQRSFKDKVLNMSYVLACSNDFNETLKSIIEGLNSAGFSKNDCRVVTDIVTDDNSQKGYEKTSIFDLQADGENQNVNDESQEINTNLFDISQVTQELKQYAKIQTSNENTKETQNYTIIANPNIAEMLNDAVTQIDEYETAIEILKEEGIAGYAPELRNCMNSFKMNEEFKKEFDSIVLPQFCCNVGNTLFDDTNEILVSKDILNEGFKLTNIPTPNQLTVAIDNVYKIDVITLDDGIYAKQYALEKNDSEEFKKILMAVPEQSRINNCKKKLVCDLNAKFNCISYDDLLKYIDRIVDDLNEDEVIELQNNIMSVEMKIKDFIENALDEYRYENFKKLLEIEKIYLSPTYKFPLVIHPKTKMSFYPSSLYTEEDDNLTAVETIFISKVSNLENVKCWHRIIERSGFCLNGFINHYPDFIIFTKKGKIILVETKGEHLSNDDSRRKLELGKIWENKTKTNDFKYFMAFEKNPMEAEGSYRVDDLINIIKNL